MSAPVITFLSDYGLSDDFVGVCHGVIATIAPQARVIDLTHGIPRHDVQRGALVLAGAIPYTPVGVHVAVVDPDVGAQRRAVALRTGEGRLLVGPDNGLLWLAAQQDGGIDEASEITYSPFRLEPVSATFHGRDIFAPVAARLAGGAALADAGTPLDPERLVKLELPVARLEDGVLMARAIYTDGFGNVQLSLTHEQLTGAGVKLGRRVRLELRGDGVSEAGVSDAAADDGGGWEAQYGRTFADVGRGELLIYEDASRRLAIAVAHGSAAQELGLAVGDEVRIRPL